MFSNLNRAWAIYRKSFIQALQFRAEMLGWVLFTIMPTLVIMLTWAGIYHGHESLSGYSFTEMIQYYFFFLFINSLVATHFEGHRSQEIRNGKIDHLLLKPLSYIRYIFLSDLGGKTLYFLLSFPSLVILLWYLYSTFGFTLALPSSSHLLTFLVLIAYAYVVEFCLSMLTVILTFWLESAEGFQHFKWITTSMFSGSMIPIVFMPQWLKTWSEYLPFKYMYYVPITVLQGKATLTVTDYLYLLSFSLFLIIMVQWFWKRAQFKYASAGG